MKHSYAFVFVNVIHLILISSVFGQNLTVQAPANLPQSRVITHPQVMNSLIEDFGSLQIQDAVKEARRNIKKQDVMNQIINDACGNLTIRSEFFLAIKNNDTQMLEFILTQISEIGGIDYEMHPAVDLTQNHGETGLHAAVANGSLECLKILLKSLPQGGAGYDPNNECSWADRTDKYGRTPLSLVLQKNFSQQISQNCAEILIDAGAKDALKECFEVTLRQRNFSFCLTLLKRGVDLSYRDDKHNTVFHLIAEDKNLSETQIQISEDESISLMLLMLKELSKRCEEATLDLDTFIQILLSKNSDKFSCMHLAAREDSLVTVQEIVLVIATAKYNQGVRKSDKIVESLESNFEPIWKDRGVSDAMKKFFTDEIEQFITDQFS